MRLKNTLKNLAQIKPFFRKQYDGNIELLTGTNVAGWIKNRSSSDPVCLDLFIDGKKISSACYADIMRYDLAEAGFGTGQHGFDIQLSNFVRSGPNVKIAVHLSGHKTPLISRTFSHLPPSLSTPEEVEQSAENSNNSTAISIASEPLRISDYRGRVDRIEHGEIRAWAVNRRHPGMTFDVSIFVDGVFYCTATNHHTRGDLKAKGLSEGYGGIRAKIPLRYLESGHHTISVGLPDGTMVEAATSADQGSTKAVPFGRRLRFDGISVIVPIFNAYDDLEVCIERLLTFTPKNVKLIFIDDASTDKRIRIKLESIRHNPNIITIFNENNLGFTKTVNSGIIAAGSSDVILLNSDARVTPRWLQGMMTAANSAPKIATVTAMSDRAGAFSAPLAGNENELPDGVDEITYARAFRRRGLGLYPNVPTGNGFCMLISRACIEEIGLLDADAFPRGYGEENDFCMRAGRAGWRNIIDDRTYVFHDRSKSFGDTKTELLAAGREVLSTRYPEYKNAIQVFSTCERIATARFRGGLARKDCIEHNRMAPRILFVTSSQTGGTPQTNRDLMAALGGSVDCWNLRCDSKIVELTRLIGGKPEIVRSHQLERPVDPITHLSDEYDSVIADWLLGFDFDIVHIRHIAWHSLNLARIVKECGQALVFSFHDYYTLSPTIKMIDDAGTFLGQTFFPEPSSYRQSMWPKGSLPEPTGEWLRYWRQRFEPILEQCDALITTSQSCRAHILNGFPSLASKRFDVIPHGRNFERFAKMRTDPKHGEPVRILVPGNIDQAKGLEIFCALCDFDKAGLLEFHILGDTNLRAPERYPRIKLHGKYSRSDFSFRASKLAPHLGAVFSIWDETYCHTLTELWSVGLPALVFDFPTVAGRVRESGAGWVLPHHDIEVLYRRILEIAFDREQGRMVDSAIAAWQANEGVGSTTEMMAAHYIAAYKFALLPDLNGRAPASPPIVAVAAPEGDANDSSGASYRLGALTRNDLGGSPIFVHMQPDTMLANIKSKRVNGVLFSPRSLPSTFAPVLAAALIEAGMPYWIDEQPDVRTPDIANAVPAVASLIEGATGSLIKHVKKRRTKNQSNAEPSQSYGSAAGLTADADLKSKLNQMIIGHFQAQRGLVD